MSRSVVRAAASLRDTVHPDGFNHLRLERTYDPDGRLLHHVLTSEGLVEFTARNTLRPRWPAAGVDTSTYRYCR
jgi:hypothetical protein